MDEFSGDYFIEKARRSGKSEEFLDGLRTYITKLSSNELPIIFSPVHWAQKMAMEYDTLTSILNNRHLYYRHTQIRKKKGGYRQIQIPEPELFKIQYWIKTFILDRLRFPAYLTSYQKKKSIIDNARFHTGKEIVIKFDLQNFFEDVTQKKVTGLFIMLGYGKAVAIDMAKACCVQIAPLNPRNQFKPTFACLPQGAPSSPGLSNLAGFMLDMRLAEYAQSHYFIYTRYADDLTFSGKLINKVRKSAIESIVVSEGFTLNKRKTSYVHRSNRQTVTGLSVNENIVIPKQFRKNIHTHLHNSVKFGPYEHLRKNGIRFNNFRGWLAGNIRYIEQLHPEEAKKMWQKFDQIDWL
jgi:RNA-directed DNA polymerase